MSFVKGDQIFRYPLCKGLEIWFIFIYALYLKKLLLSDKIIFNNVVDYKLIVWFDRYILLWDLFYIFGIFKIC